MSGRTKRTIYHTVVLTAWVAALVALAFMIVGWYAERSYSPWVLFAVALTFVLLPIHIFVHELGHALFGAACGMRFFSVRAGLFFMLERKARGFRLRFAGVSESAGESMFCPKRAYPHLRERFAATALGGAVCDLVYAAVFAALYFALPHAPALFFFEAFAPFCLCEAVAALFPAQLPAGKTDGAVVLGLGKGDPEELVALSVLTAQGILCGKTFAAVPRETLFSVPVVREDLRAFHALLLLRVQFLLFYGEEKEAEKQLARLEGLFEYLTEEDLACVRRYRGYFGGDFQAGEETLFGVRALEAQLSEKTKSSA